MPTCLRTRGAFGPAWRLSSLFGAQLIPGFSPETQGCLQVTARPIARASLCAAQPFCAYGSSRPFVTTPPLTAARGYFGYSCDCRAGGAQTRAAIVISRLCGARRARRPSCSDPAPCKPLPTAISPLPGRWGRIQRAIAASAAVAS